MHVYKNQIECSKYPPLYLLFCLFYFAKKYLTSFPDSPFSGAAETPSEPSKHTTTKTAVLSRNHARQGIFWARVVPGASINNCL